MRSSFHHDETLPHNEHETQPSGDKIVEEFRQAREGIRLGELTPRELIDEGR